MFVVTLPCAPAAAFEAKVRHVQVGSTRIAWYERGSGPPLLMAIGTGSTMAEWDPALLRLLARHHRLILFDYPGVGRSSATDGRRISFALLADRTAGLLRAIGVARAGRARLVDGRLRRSAAGDPPPRGRSGGWCSPAPIRAASLTVLGSPADQRIDSDPTPSDAAALRVLYPRTAAGRREGRAFLRRLDRASEAGAIPDDFDVPARTIRAQVEAEEPWLRSDANARALRRLTLPVLVTGGLADPVVPPANARRLARLIPRAQLLLEPGAHAYLFSDRVPLQRAAAALPRRACFAFAPLSVRARLGVRGRSRYAVNPDSRRTGGDDEHDRRAAHRR